MKSNYYDILDITDKEPLWYDENGCPRFMPFSPELCPNIYADECILLLIRCQDCHKDFKAQMSYYGLRGGQSFQERVWRFMKDGHKPMFSPLHYGDPPIHGCVGDTENCEDIKILEFWIRNRNNGPFRWERAERFEIGIDTEES
jgi:hypothetical protein